MFMLFISLRQYHASFEFASSNKNKTCNVQWIYENRKWQNLNIKPVKEELILDYSAEVRTITDKCVEHSKKIIVKFGITCAGSLT